MAKLPNAVVAGAEELARRDTVLKRALASTGSPNCDGRRGAVLRRRSAR